MTLRDYFAAKAMGQLCKMFCASEVVASDKAGVRPVYEEGDPSEAEERIAHWSYSIADAMIRVRSEGGAA